MRAVIRRLLCAIGFHKWDAHVKNANYSDKVCSECGEGVIRYNWMKVRDEMKQLESIDYMFDLSDDGEFEDEVTPIVSQESMGAIMTSLKDELVEQAIPIATSDRPTRPMRPSVMDRLRQ